MALKAVITNAGNNMLTKCVAAGTINFSRAEVGSGAYGSESAARAATALNSIITGANVSISRASYTGNAAQVSVQLATDSESEMTIREIGVYISDPGNSSSSVLACYAWYETEAEADHITGGALFNRLYDLVMAITGAADLTVTAALSGLQERISATGILMGDGNGGVTAAVGVTAYTTNANTYAKGNHTHALANDNSITGTLPIAKGGTGGTTLAEAQTNLGITKVIYSSSTPTVVNGAIWLQPST